MNEQRLMEIKVRADNALEGPWEFRDENEGSEYLSFWVVGQQNFEDDAFFVELHTGDKADAEFIAHARQDVPELLNKVWEQNTELKMLRMSRKMWKELDAKRAAENAELQSKLDRVEIAEAQARFELEEYQNNIDYKALLTFARKYGCSFINTQGELIICHKTNTYASLHGCKTLEDIEAKVLMAVCRPIGKGLAKRDANFQLQKFNTYFRSDLTVDDMRLIYGELCYSHKLQENKDFIRNGFPMHELAGTPHD